MAVPNTTNFNFLNVKTEITNEGGGTSNSLVQAFTNANQAHFDPAYENSPVPNSLLSYRNYGAGAGPLPTCSEWVFTGNGPFPSGEYLFIEYVDCDNSITQIDTINSQSQSGEPFCVKKILTVEMGSFQYNGPQLPGGSYNSNLGQLVGGTEEGCTPPPPICYKWKLTGYANVGSGKDYEINYIDCDGIRQNILSESNAIFILCAKEIISYDLQGSGNQPNYDNRTDGPLLPGNYHGQSASLEGGTELC